MGLHPRIIQTDNSAASLFLRVFLAIVVFPHGAQKLFGWFGGFGFAGTMDFFTNTMGLPWLIAFLVIIIESIGAIGLLIGFATRIFSLSFFMLAIGIIFSSHIQHGFFMNWFGNQAGEGYEFFLLWVGMAIALIITGGGMGSVDQLLGKK